MANAEAMQYYQAALKQGQKEYKNCVHRGPSAPGDDALFRQGFGRGFALAALVLVQLVHHQVADGLVAQARGRAGPGHVDSEVAHLDAQAAHVIGRAGEVFA